MPAPAAIPQAAEVVVIGAGPAGSACAAELARAGRDVLLLDRAAFPRDKACGDGLIPDAIAALDALGVLGRVRAAAAACGQVTVHSGRGTPLTLAGAFLTLPRRELDALLVEHAVAAGARLHERVRVHDVDADDRGVTVYARHGERERVFSAPLAVLATGAAGAPPAVYRRAGLDPPRPDAVAVRAYLRVGLEDLPPGLVISYDAAVRPGYGWVFPLPGGRVNLGTALFGHGARAGNLREVWARFVAGFAPARRAGAAAGAVGPLRGAPLAMGMQRPARPLPALVAIGEAAGLTFPASGEGIGKALESGIALARALAPAPATAPALAAAADDYAARWERDKRALYRGYEEAQRWLTRPWVSDLVARRACRRRYLRERLEAMISETEDPGRLFSLRGLLGTLVA